MAEALAVEHAIVVLRRQRVMLDADLAELYGVQVKALNQAVKRNIERFPPDFMFQLTVDEVARVRSGSVTVEADRGSNLMSQTVTSSSWGGRRRAPYAFTEQGVAMLSSILRSERAVQVNIEVMRAFVRLRRMLAENAELAHKIAALEKKYDAQFRVVFDAIRELMTPPAKEKKRIGFRVE